MTSTINLFGLEIFSISPISARLAGCVLYCDYLWETLTLLWVPCRGMVCPLRHVHKANALSLSLCTCPTCCLCACCPTSLCLLLYVSSCLVLQGHTGSVEAPTLDINRERRGTMLRHTVIYYIHRHNFNEAYLQQSDKFVPEVSSRLCNPPQPEQT